MNLGTILKATGLPCYHAVWRETPEYPQVPPQHLIYTHMATEAEYADDKASAYRLYAYLTLYSSSDVTQAIAAVRAAMREAGFRLDEERTGYDHDAGKFLVMWTWIGWEANDDGT
ncbi:MAG: hypothetical protein RSD95_10350 [Clostridia bacterium]